MCLYNTLFLELHQEEPLVLLGLGDVRRDVRVLRRLEVGPPPVADDVLHKPVLFDAVQPAEGLQQLASENTKRPLGTLLFAGLNRNQLSTKLQESRGKTKQFHQ